VEAGNITMGSLQKVTSVSVLFFIFLFVLSPNVFSGDLTLISPNGGEILPSGSSYNIQWEASENYATFNIYYSVDNGIKWKKIDKATNVRNYQWNVPILINNAASCLVKIVGYNSSGKIAGTIISRESFAIKVIDLQSPKTGESLLFNDKYTITWKSYATKKPVAKIGLNFSTDEGITWETWTCPPKTVPPVIRV
jgi:hypothetical protein